MFSPDFRTYFLEFIIIGTFADNRNKYMVISRLGKPKKNDKNVPFRAKN